MNGISLSLQRALILSPPPFTHPPPKLSRIPELATHETRKLSPNMETAGQQMLTYLNLHED